MNRVLTSSAITTAGTEVIIVQRYHSSDGVAKKFIAPYPSDVLLPGFAAATTYVSMRLYAV